MDLTSVSLLGRLRDRPIEKDWNRLVELYQPFIRQFIKLDPKLAADAADISQEVMTKVVAKLPRFVRQRPGSFRKWLKTITVNEVNLYWRKRLRRPDVGGGLGQSLLESMCDPANELGRRWDREHDEHVIRRLLELLEPEFAPTVWRAFALRVFEEKNTEQVAAILAISEEVVVAKSRVLARLREEAAGLID